MRLSTALAFALLFATFQSTQAVEFYPIAGATSSTEATDLWPVSNLIQGPGVGFDANEPHTKEVNGAVIGGPGGSWVTADDAGFPADYIEEVGMPVLTFDLGEDVDLEAISVWNYEANANGISEFSLTFSTDAQGPGGGTATAGPFVLLGDRDTGFYDFTTRQNFEFDSLTARYVELTAIDNFFVAPGDGADDTNAGGDRVGLGEVAFPLPEVDDLPSLQIDRATGNITLDNSTAEVLTAYDIAGYNLVSLVGGLDNAAWISVADNGDADSGGSVDPNNNWIVFNSAADDIAEGSLGTANLAIDQVINLGDMWVQNPTEDVAVDLLLADGEVVRIAATFTGNNDAPFELADLDFDGDVDADDWPTYRDGFGADLSALSAAQAYQRGDLNADGVNNSTDFGIFKGAFEAANGPGSFEAMLASVPEPSTALLLLLPATILGLRLGFRTYPGSLRRCLGAALAVAFAAAASSAVHAQNWYSIVDATASTSDTDLWPVSNLIQGPGVGFDASAPYDKTSTGADGNWVTDAPAGGVPADYIEDVGIPVLTFDLGADLDLDQIDIWGYSSTNANGIKDFSLRFATESDGLGGFGTTIGFNPSFADVDVNETPRQGFEFGQTVNARYVELTVTDNHWAAPGDGSEPGTLAGGDRVGIGEVAFPVVGNAPVLTLQLDPVDGDAQLISESPIDVEIDLYEIFSEGGSLNPTGWRSLEDQNIADFPAGSGSGDGWEELGTPAEGLLAEGYLQGSSIFETSDAIYLGSIFSTAEAMDVEFNYRTPDGVTVFGNVNYVNVDAPVGGDDNADFNGDNFVDGSDFAILQRNFGSGTTQAQGDADGDGDVDGDDQAVFDAQFGAAPPLAGPATAAVPEPASIGLSVLALLGLVGRRSVRRGLASVLAVACVYLVASSAVLAARTADRLYLMGDEAAEGASAGNFVDGETFDSIGQSAAGNFQDLSAFIGQEPVYVDVSDRPLAGSSQLGLEFDGDFSQAFLEGKRLGLPSTSEPAVLGDDGLIPEDYSGIANRGFQLWVKPAANDRAQSIVMDTNQHGLRISAGGNWSMRYNGADFESTVAATPDEWVHAMVVRPTGVGPNSGSRLYINGVAVAASLGGYNGNDDSSLVVGANTDPDFNLVGTAEFFEGVVDDLEMFILGVNDADFDYGTFNLVEDNEFVADLFTGIPDGDVNGDGQVMGDGTGGDDDDVAQFISNWKFTNSVNGIAVGDANSRAAGDFNFDGVVNLGDWHVLRTNHPNGASLNLGALLSTSVPEPSTAVAGVLLAAAGLLLRRRMTTHG